MMNGFGKFLGSGKGFSTIKFALVFMVMSMVMIGGITAMAMIIQAL